MSKKQKECGYVVDPNTFNTVLLNYRTREKFDLMDDFEIFKTCDGDRDKIALFTAVLRIEAEKA